MASTPTVTVLIADAKPVKKAMQAAAAEIKRLQAIVDKLPKTKDGVPVVPGEDVVWHPAIANEEGELSPLDVHASRCASWQEVPTVAFAVSECYSTREDAEAAKEEANGSNEHARQVT